MPLQLKLTKKNIIQPITQNTRLQVEAQVGEIYTLVDPMTGKTPNDVVIRRLGDNLLVESPSQAGMVEIEDFWKTCSSEHSCQMILDVSEQAGASKMILTQNNNPLPFLQAGQVGSLSAGQTLGQVSSETAISIPVHYWNKIVLATAGLALGALVYGQEKNGDESNTTEARSLQGTIALSDSKLLKGETAFVVISLNDPLSALDTSYFIVGNASLSNLMTLDNGRTWTATLTPEQGINLTENSIQLFDHPTSDTNRQQIAISPNYEIATNQPPLPTIALAPESDTGVIEGHGTNITQPELQGTGIPGNTIFIRDGLEESGTAHHSTTVVGDDGTWQLTLENPILEGQQKIVGYQQDVNGNKSELYSFDIVLDTTKPWVVFATMDDTFLAPGDSTIIKLYFIEPVLDFNLSDMMAENGTLSDLQKLDATANGYHPYQITFTAGNTLDLFNAFYLSSSYTDLFGNISEHDQGWANYAIFNSSGGGGSGDEPPPPPTISIGLTTAYDTFEGDPSGNNKSTGNTPEFTGSANPNTALIITIGGDDTIYQTTADAMGQWSLSTSPTMLVDGEYTVYVTYELSPTGSVNEIAAYKWEII